MDGRGATSSGVGVGGIEGGEGIPVEVVGGMVDGGFS